MSESILNALIQLFALTAIITRSIGRDSKYVENLLKQHIHQRFLSDYLKLYEDHIDLFLRDFPPGKVKDENNYQNIRPLVERVCFEISTRLSKPERVLVIIKLLEYLSSESKISSQKDSIIDSIASCFSVDPHEINNLKQFVLNNCFDEIDSSALLYIENHQEPHNESIEGVWVKKDCSEWISEDSESESKALESKMIFLHIPSIETFLLQHFGNQELYLDGKLIELRKHYIVEEGAVIRGPLVKPLYYSDLTNLLIKSKSNGSIVFTAENLDFYFRNSDNGIRNFSFSEESGQLIAIMGSSGVGKSTLLNLLTGKLKPRSGRVLINGYDIHRDKRTIEGIIGYVPQDDLLFENLTVYQNLYYNAKLCFSNFNEAKIREAVKRMLDDLDIWDIRDLKVGSPLNKLISGGQRKRLNIGLELMREPSILFIDEPTSGLSSSDSIMVMRLLKEQANKGRLVIVNIHQPSSKVFRLVDKLWILDKGGVPIFSGNPQDAIVYFKAMSTQVNATESGCPQCGTLNPDQILEIVEAKVVSPEGNFTHKRQRSPHEWNELYRQKIEPKIEPKPHGKELPKNYFNIPNVEVQFKIFYIRNLLSKLANKQYVFISLMEAPLLALILAFFTKYIAGNEYIFADNKNLPAYLFMSILVALFIGLTVSAEEIISDQKILERESFLNLSRFSYLNAKIFYLFGLSAVQMFMFVLVGNTILEINGMLLQFWLILFTTACFANMIGLNISAGLNSVITIYITIPLIMVPHILLSGTVVQFDNLHPSVTRRIYVPVVGDLMVSRWAYEAITVEQFKNNPFQKEFFEKEQIISSSHFKSAFLVPRLQNLIEECTRMKEQGTIEDSRYARNLNIIRNELIAMHLIEGLPPFEFIWLINAQDFSEMVAEETTSYLFFIRISFTNIGNEARQSRDSIYNFMVDNLGADKVFTLRQQNYNKALANWLLNTNEVNKYLETDNRIIQKFEPIYMLPEHNWGRAHFYAPFKRFNKQYVNTIWFNLTVIWLAALLLFVTLQANLLGRIINLIESIRIRKMMRRVQNR